MCLGNQAREANKAAKRKYEYQLKVREQNWMNTLSLENVKRVQYAQTQDAAHVGLGNAYAQIQQQYNDQIAEATQSQEEAFRKFAQDSTSDRLAASGATGQSIRRIRTLDVGNYLAGTARQAYALTQSRRDLNEAGAQAAAQAREAQMNAFAQNNIVRNPDLAPPPPVYRNVGQAAFMDALKIGTSVASMAMPFVTSSKKVKDNIVKIGRSIQGHNIYKFNYKGGSRRYVGVIAEEIQQTKPEAVVTMPNGVIGVNYDLIDVNFKEVPA